MNHLRAQWRQAAKGRTWTPPDGVLYHGTSREAAKAIRESGFRIVEKWTTGRTYGDAIYLTADRDYAADHARRELGGAVVTARLRPGARILNVAYAWEDDLIDQHYENIPGPEMMAIAVANGYHGLADDDGWVVAVFDLSVLEVVS